MIVFYLVKVYSFGEFVGLAPNDHRNLKLTGEVSNHAGPNTAHDSSVAEYVVCAYKYFSCLGEETTDAVQQGVLAFDSQIR